MAARISRVALLSRVLSLMTLCLTHPTRANISRSETVNDIALIEVLLDQDSKDNEVVKAEQKNSESISEKVVKILHGLYANFRPSENMTGLLKMVSEQPQKSEPKSRSTNGQNWVGVLIFEDGVSDDEIKKSATTAKDTLIERMKNAIVLGASAFIVLAMNKNVLKEMKNAIVLGASAFIVLAMNKNVLKERDVTGSIIRVPVVIIEDLQNITALLAVLASKLTFRVTISSYTASRDVETYTIWSHCYRSQPGGGVVCMSGHQSTDSRGGALFWSYFYSALAVLMLIMLIKAEPRELIEDSTRSESVVAVVRQALSHMKTKRMGKNFAFQSNNSNSDLCAICLDPFYFRQRIRVLPCFHEFHCKCIDPWLLQQPTCPLCKYKVVTL